jgi:hypothetical protein
MKAAITAGVTLAEFCKLYRIGQTKALNMIDRAELVAVNTADDLSKRPRWVITQQAIQEWERRRSSKPPPAKPKRSKRPKVFDYFPD